MNPIIERREKLTESAGGKCFVMDLRPFHCQQGI